MAQPKTIDFKDNKDKPTIQEYDDMFRKVFCPVAVLPRAEVMSALNDYITSTIKAQKKMPLGNRVLKLELIEHRESSSLYRIVFGTTDALDYELHYYNKTHNSYKPFLHIKDYEYEVNDDKELGYGSYYHIEKQRYD